MKKVFLTIAGSLLGLAMFAKMSHTDSIKAIDKSWRAAYRATASPKMVLFNFTDSLICPEKNAAGTSVVYQHNAGTDHNCGLNYIDYEPQGGANSTLSTYFSKGDGCLRVDYDQSANITSFGKGTDNWGDVMKTYWVQKVQPTAQTAGFNPFRDTTLTNTTTYPDHRAVPGDSIVGVMLDLSDTTKRLITITYEILSGLPATDSADIRFDLFDVNGRSTGGHSTRRVIGRPALGDNDLNFHQITFSWANPEGGDWTQGAGMVFGTGDADLDDEDQKDFSDGYQATWFNLPNGRGYSAVNTVGPAGQQGLFDFSNAAINYPADGGGNSVEEGDPWLIPMDPAHVVGFEFMINDGPSCLYHTAKFSLLIKSIIIGDASQAGTCAEYIFGKGSKSAGQQCAANKVALINISDTMSATIDTVGGSIQMFAQVLPATATNKAISWSVSNTNIATISSSGLLTATGNANGNVIVTATASDGGGTTGTEVVAITNQVALQIAYEDTTSKTPTVGDQIQFSVSNASSGIIWSVSNSTIASINASSGLLTALAAGTVTIKAIMADGSLLPGSETIAIGNYLVIPYLVIPFATASIGSAGRKDSVEVESSTSWTATSNQTWLTVSQNVSSGNGIVTFTAVANNPTTATRTAIITVSASGATSRTVTVTQAAGAATLSVSAVTATIPMSATSTSITITSNTTWTATSNESWLSVSPNYATGNATATLTATANPTTVTRTATVTFSASGTSQAVTVTQAAGTPTLEVSSVTATIPSQATSTSVYVYSNTAWTASSNESWLNVSPGTETGNGYLTFSTTALPTAPSRSATVTVSASGVASQTITVNQAEASLEVSAVTATVPTSATSTSVYIYSNTNWTASSNESWLTVSSGTKTGSGYLTLSTNAMPTLANSTATITVSSPGLAAQTITVTADVLTVAQTDVVVAATAGSSATVAVSSNTTWMATSNQSWLFVNPTTTTTGSGSITFLAIADTGAARTATVTVVGIGVPTQTITVTQSASTATNCGTISIVPTTVNPLCNGESTGSIAVSVSGGTAPYNYKWSTNNSDNTIVTMPAGNYSIKVIDALGCVAFQSFTITQPTPIAVNPTITTPSCGGTDGGVSLAVSGGTPSYTYNWNTGNHSQILANVAAGSYTVTITDASSCTQTEHITVSNSGAPVATVNSIVPSSCNPNNGSIGISISGGTIPYSFMWNDGVTTQNRNSLAPNNYNLSITDAHGCVAAVDTVVPATTFPIPSIALVTVDSATKKNEIIWLRDNTDAISYYTIYRESITAGLYTMIGNVSYSKTSVFVDTSAIADPTKQSWRYKLSATDYCGNEVKSPVAFKTIFLQQGAGLQANSVNLLWDSYEGTDFYTYSIFRLLTSNEIDSIGSVSSDVYRYTDNDYSSDVKGYYIAIDLPSAIDPSKLKSANGVFRQSVSNMAVSQLTGVKEQHLNAIALYPNPAHRSFTISGEESAQVEVYTVNGTLVLSTRVTGKEPIATNGLPTGLYVVKIVTAQQVVTRSLVVE